MNGGGDGPMVVVVVGHFPFFYDTNSKLEDRRC
jgi:hypothetical protein